ncbi:MAG: hypothetical protein H7A46_23880 [Verrucomicrobiales bacterium]|nr:hypothetical protein [Verrucomicrobiales bacterium]
MTDDEWNANWNSLRHWLRQRYAVDWMVDKQRHLSVEGDYARPERSLTIYVSVAEALTFGLLKFVQDWLQKEARLWRVFIPTDNTDENLIVVYPEAIRANPEAEANLPDFVQRIRPSLATVIEEGRKQFGIPTRPHPPLPPE